MTVEVKAKVLDYRVMYHSAFCGRAKVQLLEGKNKGRITNILTVKHCQKDDVIIVYESG